MVKLGMVYVIVSPTLLLKFCDASGNIEILTTDRDDPNLRMALNLTYIFVRNSYNQLFFFLIVHNDG